MSATRVLRGLLGVLLVAAAALFLGITVARNWRELSAFDWDVAFGQLAASILALAAVLAWGVWVWQRVLIRFEERVSFPALARIWFLSNLARYIPGKVWQFVGAAELARAAGISRTVLLTSMVVHVGFSLLSAAVVAVATLAPRGLLSEGLPVGLLAGAVAALFLVHPAVLNRGLRLVPRALHRDVLVWRGRWRDGLWLLALSVISWALYGLAFTMFVDSILEVPLALAVPLTGVNALSFLAGYFAFITPAGLGAREAAMALLLAPFASPGIAAVIAVVSRLWVIAAELLGAIPLVGRPPIGAETAPTRPDASGRVS